MIVIAVSFFVYRFVSSYISDTYKVLHLFSRVILRIFGLLQNKYNWCDKNIFFEIIFLVSKIIHFFKYYTINSFYYFLYYHILYFFFLHVSELRKVKFLVLKFLWEIHPYTSFVLILVLLEKESISFATKISKIIQNKLYISCIVNILKIIFTLFYFTLFIFNYVNQLHRKSIEFSFVTMLFHI